MKFFNEDEVQSGGVDNILKGLDNINFSSKFLDKRSVFLWGAVMDDSAEQVVNRLLYLDMKDSGKPISFYINSPGGSVTAGLAIYDTMKLIKSPVSTICMGMCASMGSILLSGGEKGSRFIFPNAEVMIHQPSIGGHFQDKASNLEITAKQINRTKQLTAKILAENCGRDFDSVLSDIENDYWMDSDEALSYGIVDKKLESLEW